MYRRRWAVVACWAVALGVALPLLPGLPRRLRAGGFSDPRLPSAQAEATLARELGVPLNVLAVFYSSPSRPYADPAIRGAVTASLARLRELPQVVAVVPPDLNTRQIGRSGRAAYAVVS